MTRATSEEDFAWVQSGEDQAGAGTQRDSHVTNWSQMLVPRSGQGERGRQKTVWTMPSLDQSTKNSSEEFKKEDVLQAGVSHKNFGQKL